MQVRVSPWQLVRASERARGLWVRPWPSLVRASELALGWHAASTTGHTGGPSLPGSLQDFNNRTHGESPLHTDPQRRSRAFRDSSANRKRHVNREEQHLTVPDGCVSSWLLNWRSWLHLFADTSRRSGIRARSGKRASILGPLAISTISKLLVAYHVYHVYHA